MSDATVPNLPKNLARTILELGQGRLGYLSLGSMTHSQMSHRESSPITFASLPADFVPELFMPASSSRRMSYP